MAQFSDEAIREITEYLEKQGLEWSRQFIAGRKAYLQQQGTRASGNLIASLQSEVLSTLEDAARTRIELEFALHGRFIDMKRLTTSGGGNEYISALEDWIVQKGLEQKFRGGFLRRRSRRTAPANILNQMAWGIAISRTKKYRRRSAWYNKPKSASISDLYNQVVANLPDLVADEIKKAFKTT